MHNMGLMGKRPKEKYHSYRGETGRVADNIINRDFGTDAPLQKWTTDVSQFNFSWGKCYLSPILDMNSNEIISYDLSLSPNLEQIQRMLNNAFAQFPSVKGLIFHSDQGWQYQHFSFVDALQKKGIIQSMSRKGNCYDNALMESFFGTMKSELLYLKGFSSLDEFEIELKKYIKYYNCDRIKTRLKTSPVNFRKQYQNSITNPSNL